MRVLTNRVQPKEAKAVKKDLAAMAGQLKAGNALNLGDTGKAVSALQRQLASAGVYAGPVNGTFDAATATAVAALQKGKGLEASGIVGGKTLKAIKSTQLFVKDGFQIPARSGQRGSDVLRAERALAKLGFRPGKADGIFDKATAAAVERFRRADPQVKDKGQQIDKKLYSELGSASKSYNHTPFSRRTIGSVKQHDRLDVATANAAKRGAGIGPGAKGRAVENVEKHLEAAGYELGTANGEFGSRTTAAVKAFQKASGLTQTGVVDEKTWSKLKGALFAATGAASPAQRLGERDASVKRTEQKLKLLGFNPGKIDGTFSSATEKAVKAFQKRKRLDVSGRVGNATLRALDKAVEATTAVRKPPVTRAPSPNQNSRGGTDIDSIVLHHTASNSTAGDLRTLRSPAAEVSAHYLIGRNGKIYQLVNDSRRAWHAGDSALRGVPTDMNSRSIGIEITNAGDGRTKFSEGQYKALEQLVPWLAKKYKVPQKNLVGHKDIAVPRGRKTDPASNFDFKRIRRAVGRAIG